MSHVRKQLRDAVIAALGSGVPALGGRVDKVRGYLRNHDRLPAVEVSTPGEQSDTETTDGVVGRNVELVVTLFVAGSADVEDQCDTLAVGIEKSIRASGDVRSIVKDVLPESMSFEMVGEGEKRLGQMQISFAALLWTFADDPETAI